MISEWAQVIIASITTIGGIVGAWLTARAGARKELGAIGGRVKTLEENEAVDVQKARDEARAAMAAAAAAQGAIDQHLAAEKERRQHAREIGERRDAAIAAKVEGLATAVTVQGTQLALLLDGRVSAPGGPRGR